MKMCVKRVLACSGLVIMAIGSADALPETRARRRAVDAQTGASVVASSPGVAQQLRAISKIDELRACVAVFNVDQLAVLLAKPGYKEIINEPIIDGDSKTLLSFAYDLKRDARHKKDTVQIERACRVIACLKPHGAKISFWIKLDEYAHAWRALCDLVVDEQIQFGP